MFLTKYSSTIFNTVIEVNISFATSSLCSSKLSSGAFVHVFVGNGGKKKQYFSAKWMVKKKRKLRNGVRKLKRNLMIGMKDEMNS